MNDGRATAKRMDDWGGLRHETAGNVTGGNVTGGASYNAGRKAYKCHFPLRQREAKVTRIWRRQRNAKDYSEVIDTLTIWRCYSEVGGVPSSKPRNDNNWPLIIIIPILDIILRFPQPQNRKYSFIVLGLSKIQTGVDCVYRRTDCACGYFAAQYSVQCTVVKCLTRLRREV